MRMFSLRAILGLTLVSLSPMIQAADRPAVDRTATDTSSASPAVSKNQEGVAVSGYDVVAYFDQKQAMRGNPSINAVYRGATYLFISDEHRAAFIKDPDSFIPQYGGFCAYGTSQGHKATADPEAWTVLDGKLYLNSNKELRKAFLKDSSAKLKDADTNWEKLKK